MRGEGEAGAGGQATRPDALLIAAAAVLVILGGLYLAGQRQQALRYSPAGFDGLRRWLSSEGVSAQSFTGGWALDASSVGLLVIPLYDTALDTERVLATTKDELLLQADEYDLTSEVITAKAERVPTMVVLPKWRSGMRLTNVGHPVLLQKARPLEGIVNALTGETGARMRFAGQPFTSFRYTPGPGVTLSAELYAAQTIHAPVCEPVIGQPGSMLLADCPVAGGAEGARMLVLADPDLFNNHGLRLGENAHIARHLFAARAGDGNVVIDYSRLNWLRDPDATESRERTWADLLRFFEPPFISLWIGTALATALALWRGALRYGPAITDRLRYGAGKSQGLAARARLMRRTDQDGALVAEYARARIAAVAAHLFGPGHARHYSDRAVFLGYVERRHPGLEDALARVLERIDALPARISPTDAIARIDDLETILEKLTHDA